LFRKKILMVLLLAVCVGSAVGTVAAQGGVPTEDKGKEIAKARLELARKGLAVVEKRIPGAGNYAGVYIWSKRVLDAELGLCGNEDDRIAALEAHVERTTRLARTAKEWFDRKVFLEEDLLEAEYHRLDAEAMLAKARAAKVPPPK
jgi:hypothetical protein